MNTLEENETLQDDYAASPRVKMRMLQQMAEALEDEASAIYRRAASFEEEETSLHNEVEERRTEINRLNLKLHALCSERDSLMQRIVDLEKEAAEMREEACNIEDDLALAYVENGDAENGVEEGWQKLQPDSRSGVFFNRMTLTDQVG